jgi:hypothetical protein
LHGQIHKRISWRLSQLHDAVHLLDAIEVLHDLLVFREDRGQLTLDLPTNLALVLLQEIRCYGLLGIGLESFLEGVTLLGL